MPRKLFYISYTQKILFKYTEAVRRDRDRLQKPAPLRQNLHIGRTPIMLEIAKVVPRGICHWDNVGVVYIRLGFNINSYHATPLSKQCTLKCQSHRLWLDAALMISKNSIHYRTLCFLLNGAVCFFAQHPNTHEICLLDSVPLINRPRKFSAFCLRMTVRCIWQIYSSGYFSGKLTGNHDIYI